MHEYLATIFDKLTEENKVMEWLMPGVKSHILKKNIEKGKIIGLSPVCVQYTNPVLTYLLRGP
jgi:hypothetical protein